MGGLQPDQLLLQLANELPRPPVGALLLDQLGLQLVDPMFRSRGQLSLQLSRRQRLLELGLLPNA